jgi:hypothetical protein
VATINDRGRRFLLWTVVISTDNIRDLVLNPAVEDTHNIHRTAFRIWRTAERSNYVTTRPAWIASLMEFAIRLSVMASLVAFGGVLLKGGIFSA